MPTSCFITPERCAVVHCLGQSVGASAEAARDLDQRARRFAEEMSLPIHQICPRPGGETETLMSPGEKHNQSCFLVSGAPLESAVTWFSLSALLEGFDVFVLADLTFTEQDAYRDLFFDRIRQRGGDVITMRQARLELTALQRAVHTSGMQPN